MTGEAECAHCGMQPPEGHASVEVYQVCHTDRADRPDCYRRVTVYGEPLGVLRRQEPKPAGIDDIRRSWPNVTSHLAH